MKPVEMPSKKSRKGLIIGISSAVACLGIAGAVAFTAFVYPHWAGGSTANPTAQTSASVSAEVEKTQSNFKTGDRFEIVDNSGNTVPVVIDRFVAEGAIAKDSAGNEWLVPNDMLKKWVADHPERFEKSTPSASPSSQTASPSSNSETVGRE